MGNFYANVAIRTTDLDRVTSTLEAMRRTAFVATDGNTTVVFDEKCDEQDLEELQRLATELSKRLDAVAFAVCNHDDDVLWYALFKNGAVLDIYDSNPGYFDGASDGPRGGDASILCEAFEVPNQRDAVAALLGQSHESFIFEIDRHESLRARLGLPDVLSLLGYRYVTRGDLANHPAAARLRAVGLARHPSTARDDDAENQAAAALQPMDERTRTAIEREGESILWESYALALHEAEVPERFVPLFGALSGNGHHLFTKLSQYVLAKKLHLGGGWIRADDLLAEFLGEREFVTVALARLLRRALRIPPLTPDEKAAFQRGDPAMLSRIAGAIDQATSAAEKEGRK